MNFGAAAEDAVQTHLERQGFEILGRNVRVGRLELDIIAIRGRLIVVCEVRARRHPRPFHPAQTIAGKKLQRVRKAAGKWAKLHQRARKKTIRIDAAAVTVAPDGAWHIEYYENISMPTRALG